MSSAAASSGATENPPPAGTAPAPAATAPQGSERLYYGGSIEASFGDVQYISLTPMLGYCFSPKLSAGVSLFYV